jgi:hypothetical protein
MMTKGSEINVVGLNVNSSVEQIARATFEPEDMGTTYWQNIKSYCR